MEKKNSFMGNRLIDPGGFFVEYIYQEESKCLELVKPTIKSDGLSWIGILIFALYILMIWCATHCFDFSRHGDTSVVYAEKNRPKNEGLLIEVRDNFKRKKAFLEKRKFPRR